MGKQLRYSTAFIIIILLISFFYLYGAESVDTFSDDYQLTKTTIPIEEEEKIFCGTPIEELEGAYEYAPKKVKNIVVRLKDSNAYKKRYIPAALFVGDKGTWKTTTAKAVPYKAGWCHAFFKSTDFLEKNRNSTAVNLRDTLKSLQIITENGTKTVLIIDEIDILLKNSRDAHYDTDTTARAILLFLDGIKNNKNIFVIGTLNSAADIPEELKDRLLSKTIIFPKIADCLIKKNIFMKMLCDEQTVLDPECEKSLPVILESLTQWSWRNFEELAFAIVDEHMVDKPDAKIRIIEKHHIERALRSLEKIKEHINYNKPTKTMEECQQDWHKESIALQKQIHESTSNKIILTSAVVGTIASMIMIYKALYKKQPQPTINCTIQ